MVTGLWSQDEHAKFLLAIKLYPQGPWRNIAAYVGTRSIRQVQTHAQKYHEKVVRRMRGLHKGRHYSGRKEHRIDDDMLAACKLGEGFGVIVPNPIETSASHQQYPVVPVVDSMEFSFPLVLASTSGSTSPSGVDSNGFVDIIFQGPTAFGTCCWLPTIDESLDFLIACLLV